MLGIREKPLYGNETYCDLIKYIGDACADLNVDVEFFQSNHEGAIVDTIQSSYKRIDGIIINPAAYTHTSIAILDALKSVNIPCVEVHLTDIDSREDFRKISYIRNTCIATFSGLGFLGYKLAVEKLVNLLYDKK